MYFIAKREYKGKTSYLTVSLTWSDIPDVFPEWHFRDIMDMMWKWRKKNKVTHFSEVNIKEVIDLDTINWIEL